MPTLPLFSIPTDPNASHAVIAPGGYESWRFDVEERAGDRKLTITFFDGCPHLPEYRRAYRAFIARPTKVAPPLPREYAAIEVALSGDRPLQTLIRVLPNDVIASCERLDVTLGGGRCFARDDEIVVTLSHEGLRVDLRFRSKRDATLMYDVDGTVEIGSVRIDPFRGHGAFAHQFGATFPTGRR